MSVDEREHEENMQVGEIREERTETGVRVQVHLPDGGAAPVPCLVWAHGGGFVSGDLVMPEASWVAAVLAQRGVAVVLVDYRLATEGARYPAGSDDVIDALRWTQASATALGVDPSAIILGGGSAGGNLAAGAVLRILGRSTPVAGDIPAPPAAMVLGYPTLLAAQPAPNADLRDALDEWPEVDVFGPATVLAMYEAYVGGAVTDPPLAVVPAEAEPHDLAGYPPALIIDSDVDELRISSAIFVEKLRQAGRVIEHHIEPGTAHGHLNRPEEQAARDSIDRIARWIRSGMGA